MKRLYALTLLALLASPAFTQTHSLKAESVVRTTLSEFIQAFDNLDWDRFRNSFADDATVFYPREFPHRADGRAEFERTFQHVFEQIRAGRLRGPYMDLRPLDLKIQIAGEVAIATFHLDDRPGFLNRRTIVLHKTAKGWKIIHLHASEVRIVAQQDR
jgi:ketosteroid isomerase-like protein